MQGVLSKTFIDRMHFLVISEVTLVQLLALELPEINDLLKLLKTVLTNLLFCSCSSLKHMWKQVMESISINSSV